jgi:ubiquinone/menaquinone biosynthesis C-methylase UbiE
MDVEMGYRFWSSQYDTNLNKTRDLEAIALKETLGHFQCKHCLEIGCGTGKNTGWLGTICQNVTAVDLTKEMLAIAKSKINATNINFVIADINEEWNFANNEYDLATFSLVLEHIQDLEAVFEKLSKVMVKDGYVYIGELHPFKQYAGSKARFMTELGEQVVNCYNHNLSDFYTAAKKAGFVIEHFNEYFDDNDRANIPRILTILCKKI